MNLSETNSAIMYYTTSFRTGNLRILSSLDHLAIRYYDEQPNVVQLEIVKCRCVKFANSLFWQQLKHEYPSIEISSISNRRSLPILTITDPFDCIRFKFEFSGSHD